MRVAQSDGDLAAFQVCISSCTAAAIKFYCHVCTAISSFPLSHPSGAFAAGATIVDADPRAE
jgi:hypothetical protein